jgi:hypothetical protein
MMDLDNGLMAAKVGHQGVLAVGEAGGLEPSFPTHRNVNLELGDMGQNSSTCN